MARVSEQPAKRPQVVDPVVRRRLATFATLLIACFVTSWLPLPFSLATIVFAAWALVLGIVTLRRVRRSPERGMAVPLLMIGVFSALLLVLSTGSVAVVWPVQQAWQECRSGARTVAAIEQCDRTHREDVEEHLRRITGLSRSSSG